MRYLARTAAGRPLAGDEEGFVPLGSAYPDASSIRDALSRAPDGLPTIDGATAAPVPREALTFGPFVERPSKPFGIGLILSAVTVSRYSSPRGGE